MSQDQPTPAPEPAAPSPRPSGRRRKWLLGGLGCAAAALLLCCCAPAGGLGWLSRYGEQLGERQRREDADRLFREALAGGDGTAAFDRSDDRFRKAHRREEVIRFFDDHPALRQRDQVSVTKTLVAYAGGGTYYKALLTVAGQPEAVVVYYVLAGGVPVLLGLEPGLADAIPPQVRGQFIEHHPSRGRRHHWHFD